MKKIVVFVILALMFTSCQSSDPENVVDEQYNEYMRYISSLDSQDIFESNVTEFDIKIVKNTTNKNNYRYDIIIDNPSVEMHNIKALAKLEVEDGYSYPSIGILEDDRFSLIPNVIDKENNIYKGINLSGISPYPNRTVYVYITYYVSVDTSSDFVEKFIEVGSDAT